ncbi:M14 family metallopeptidase [Tunicatimonas pelagia]|uniref:M14 family metallopeptidase n=1 Tax=Tunicatimonas pelagia TaxID=931531 RepID=UPI0026653CBF|nr:M14 family metallopeptidase [Tunicatimonas pelagia]WKN41130.1 M14 family metallopeptidase [Tunicatimonas pelagia]
MRYSIGLLLSLTTSLLFGQIPTPADFLGYELGKRFTRHAQVINYFERVAETADQVSLVTYGETYEHRPLVLTYVTSPENTAQLEAIQAANLARAGLREGDDKAFDNVAIVWLSYNVHGNEAVATEAAMQLLYELSSGDNSQATEWLKNTVVIIDPCINPDGRDRYVNWYNQKVNTITNVQPDSWEHDEPWPGGRMNHYLFDLNRDWAWATQTETRQRLTLYNQWLPHIHADYHEQGVNSPYYFAPAAEPYHAIITEWQRELQTMIGKNNARYFDEAGWLYFTRERFDLLYPSYGDTYPMFSGAIGMTYEQGGSGRAGLAVLTEEGDTLTLKDRIAHHVTTSLSTIEVASQNAERIVREFSDFYQQSQQGKIGNYQSYVVKDSNPEKIAALRSLLDTHEIQYGESTTSRNLSGFSYQQNGERDFRVEQGDLIISTSQPKSVLLQTLFEPEAELTDSITYDITAWTIPYAYDLDAYALTADINSAQEFPEATFTPQSVEEPAYAYVSKWDGVQDARFLSQLIRQGIKVRYSARDFSVAGQAFDAGTLIITRANNQALGEEFDQKVVLLANSLQQEVTPIRTGYVESGFDLGSGEIHYIEPPKVLLAAGEDVSPYGLGEIWYFFEQEITYPVSVINAESLKEADLSDYNTLILPDGRYAQILENIDLKNWIQQGGKVIALESALTSFKRKEEYQLSEYSSIQEKDRLEQQGDAYQAQHQLSPYEDQERRNISNYISGSIFKLRLDNTHPLGLGYPEHYFTLKRGSSRYGYLEEGENVATLESMAAPISGFAGAEIQKRLPNSLIFGVEEVGDGTIVYLVDNPLFRAFWQNGKLLFSNALFLVGQD